MITVNGKSLPYPEKMTLASLLLAEGFTAARVVVERNGEILTPAAFESTLIQDGDCLEVVSFVGGG